MKLFLIPVSSERWGKPEFSIAVEQAKDAVRRINKKFSVRNERVRFTLACEQIETMALQQKGISCLTIVGSKANSFKNILSRNGDTPFPFIIPSDIKEFKTKLSKEISEKIPANGGLVAVLRPFANNYSQPIDFSEEKTKIHSKTSRKEFIKKEVEFTQSEQDPILLRVHKQFQNALYMNEPFGWINIQKDEDAHLRGGHIRHKVFTKVIREYIGIKEQPTEVKYFPVDKEVVDEKALLTLQNKWWYRLLKILSLLSFSPKAPMKIIMVTEERIFDLPITPQYIRFAFKDGSEGKPFPLFCLPPIEKPLNLPVIRAALISCRHFELDTEVDICLLHNSEINRGQDAPISEQEEFAFKKND